MKHKKYVLQKNIKDCAVACLYNIIRYYSGNININKLRNLLNTDKTGTNVYNIVKVSNDLGLKATAYSCELNDLCNLKYPLIAHIKVDEKFDHFIIIEKIKDDEIFIFDPIRGYLKYEIDQFEKEFSNVIITFEKTNNLINEKNKNILQELMNYILKNSYILIFIFILSIISSLLLILHSLYLSYLYNKNILSYKTFILFIIICISKLIVDYIKNNKILDYALKFDFNITSKTYNKILSLPLIYHHSRPVGDIISRINDLSSVKEFINNISLSFMIDFTYILLISIILFIINKTMFILLIIMSSIYILIYTLFRKIIIKKSLLTKESSSTSNTHLVESLLGVDTIKNINIEPLIFKLFKEKYKDFLNNNFNLNKLIINLNSLLEFVSNITSIIIVFLSIILYKNNYISFSCVIAFNTLVVYLFSSLKNIISLDDSLIEAKNSYQRLDELYNEELEENKNKKISSINNISVKNLFYSYNDINNTINNVNFEINKNDFIFVKGRSGSGKSTIFKLITKQLKLNKGMIKINNIDINNINRKDIVDNICYVSQNEYIFTDTILNNIKLYKEANDKEVNKVIKITGIDEILKRRNITLNFLLEENGHNLSGGERQRIILARSLLLKRQVLILDETLNELDSLSEKKILENIMKNYKITLIFISHRDDNSKLFKKIIKIGGKV